MAFFNETLIEIPGIPLQLIEVGCDGVIVASSQKKDRLTIYHFHPSGELFFSFEEKLNPGETYEVFRGSSYDTFYKFKGDKKNENLISMGFIVPDTTIPVDSLLPFAKSFANLIRPSFFGRWYEASFNNNGCYDGTWMYPGENRSKKECVYSNNTYEGWMSPLNEELYNLRLITGGEVINMVAGKSRIKWQLNNCQTSLANSKLQVAAVYASANKPPVGDTMNILTFSDKGVPKKEEEMVTPVPGAPVIPISLDDHGNMIAAVSGINGQLIPYYYGMRSNGIVRQWQQVSDLISVNHRKYLDSGFCRINPGHPTTHPSGTIALQPVDNTDGKILVLSPVQPKKPFIPADLIRFASIMTKEGWVNTIDNLVITLPNGKKIVLRKIKTKPRPPVPGSLSLYEDEFEAITPATHRDLFAGLVQMVADLSPTNDSYQMLMKTAKQLSKKSKPNAKGTKRK